MLVYSNVRFSAQQFSTNANICIHSLPCANSQANTHTHTHRHTMSVHSSKILCKIRTPNQYRKPFALRCWKLLVNNNENVWSLSFVVFSTSRRMCVHTKCIPNEHMRRVLGIAALLHAFVAVGANCKGNQIHHKNWSACASECVRYDRFDLSGAFPDRWTKNCASQIVFITFFMKRR